MGETFIIFLILFFALALFTNETFVFILLYLFAGSFLLGNYWVRHVINNIKIEREFPQKIFANETITVKLKVHNNSWLPAIWLMIEDVAPPEVRVGKNIQKIVSIGPKQKTEITYVLVGHKRGYYRIGRSRCSTGDLLGLIREKSVEGPSDYLTVYPRVIPLTKHQLPSRSPLGTLRHTQPIFEDPSRPIGKRNYSSGDSIRRIDWKSTASTGKLQVKQFEPSIALESVIFLNLNTDDYNPKRLFDSTEFAIVVAASLCNLLTNQKQSIGLITNGLDPIADQDQITFLEPNKGKNHLMHLLEILARIKSVKTTGINTILQQNRAHLSWGTTVLILTGKIEEDLFQEIFQAKRAGMNPVLISCGEGIDLQESKLIAENTNVPFFGIRHDYDLGIWQG